MSAPPPHMSRAIALAAKPSRTPVVRIESTAPSITQVTIRHQRPRWQRILGGGLHFERTYELDAHGRQVYSSCDGESTVTEIIARFAQDNHLSLAESEIAVTAFLKTLITRELIIVPVSLEALHDVDR